MAMSHLATDLTSPPPAAPPERIWSAYQQAVFAAIEDPAAGHLVVEALAGSGKTSTIIEALSHCYEDESILLLAFNKSIATELQARVPAGVTVATCHSFGLRAVTSQLGRFDIDGKIVGKIAKGLLGESWTAMPARRCVERLVSVAKGSLIDDLDDLDAEADRQSVDFPRGWDRERLLRSALKILQVCRECSEGSIDFDDMIWLPIVRDLAVPEYDWVFVDETQDLNPAQLELLVRAAGDNGRICAVGDRRQAIYGFRGADRRAIPNIIERLDARVLPLSITYRCPLAVVAEAREFVPTLEAAPGAAAGVVRKASLDELECSAAPGDFVISRTNAPLVSLCYRWIVGGVRAEIKGRDIGQGLTSWIKGTRASTVDELEEAVDGWAAAEIKRLVEADRDTTSVEDRAECLHALASGCGTIDEILRKIDRIFGEDASGGILLTSTHRAKGLEADRVWLLRDTFLKWPGDEEENLLYVAITRTKKELIYVVGES